MLINLIIHYYNHKNPHLKISHLYMLETNIEKCIYYCQLTAINSFKTIKAIKAILQRFFILLLLTNNFLVIFHSMGNATKYSNQFKPFFFFSFFLFFFRGESIVMTMNIIVITLQISIAYDLF
jgi:hypothetical protein